MKISTVPFALFITLTVLIIGCKATTIHNVENAQFIAPSQATMENIKMAIVRGSHRAGWRTKDAGSGALMASYSYKGNRYGAVVRISYDRDSYDITYHSSHNLKYNEKIGNGDDAPDFFSNTKDFFSENNPFENETEEIPPAEEKPATIHKIYNKWVSRLETEINNELALLGKKSSRRTQTTRANRSARNTTYDCDSKPVDNASGRGKITRSSVNVRQGASTRCPILATVSSDEDFTLLGKQQNWFYIRLNNGNKGWIYAPLVTQVNEETLTSRATMDEDSPVGTPPPPAPAPTRNISIAVIHFKTLNKEAQDISLGELVSETFTSALVNSHNFKIIEREQLDKVVKEMEMNQTGFIETTDAVEIGKMLHADAIITGSVALLNNQIQLNARIIEIESAYVISADTRTTTYTLRNITTIANEIVAKLARKLLIQ